MVGAAEDSDAGVRLQRRQGGRDRVRREATAALDRNLIDSSDADGRADRGPGHLHRIGYTGPADATFETLTALVAGHTRSIPFENLDPLLGTPVTDLGVQALTDKLVRRRRGGYCYEHNGLLRYMLVQLDFGVDPLGGRVVWMNAAALDGPLPAQTHLALAVTIPGVDDVFLVDVGFGGQTLSSPIRLVAGPEQETRHEPYRLREHRDAFVLEAKITDTWQPLYLFTTRPQPLIDQVVGSWYVSTHPESTFVIGLSAALVTDDARWNLRGRNLAIHRTDGVTERIRFDTAAQVLDALTNRFGIDVRELGDVEPGSLRCLTPDPHSCGR